MRLLRLFPTVVLFVALCALAQPRHAKYAYGIIRRGCAPWDGPAINLVVTPKPSDCQTDAPYLLISVYDLPIRTGKPYSIGVQGEVGTAQASRCDKADVCDTADSGQVVFDTFKEGSSATGHYQIRLQKGGGLEGSFKLKWCNNHEMCG